MSESKHTPGPWQAIATPFSEGFTVLAQPHAALRGFTKSIAFVGDKADDEVKANARLISAAPDMLVELKRMVEHFAAWANDHSQEATTETWAAIHCARVAIAKAERE